MSSQTIAHAGSEPLSPRSRMMLASTTSAVCISGAGQPSSRHDIRIASSTSVGAKATDQRLVATRLAAAVCGVARKPTMYLVQSRSSTRSICVRDDRGSSTVRVCASGRSNVTRTSRGAGTSSVSVARVRAIDPVVASHVMLVSLHSVLARRHAAVSEVPSSAIPNAPVSPFVTARSLSTSREPRHPFARTPR